MKLVIGPMIFALILAVAVVGQTSANPDKYRVFAANGDPSSVAAIVKRLADVDVVFLGEQHDDAVGHAIEAEIFSGAVTQYSPNRRVALSLEMFERDVQVVVNEYLADQITEAHFLLSSRPWPNYKTDYRPMVELAKTKKVNVVAANAPRRYVNMVSRNGRGALTGLSKEAKSWLAPLPYGEPSPVYAAKFKALMGPSPEAQMGIDKILASQSLWDATMANSVAAYLKKNKGSLVVHLNGGFHTESHLGTVEHLLRYRPKTRVLVVTMRYEDDFKTFDPAKHIGLGDFVILTAPKPKTGGVMSEILDRIDSHNKALKTLKADVTMITTDSILKISDTSVGSVQYLPKTNKRNMYLRLDWSRPAEKQMAIIGDDFELYEPRLDQLIYGKLKSPSRGSDPVRSLEFMDMSKAELNANFEIVYLGQDDLAPAPGGVKTWHLQVTPKASTNYKSAEAWVDSDGMPRQIRVNEKNGNTTTVLLAHIQKNVAVQADVFRLNVPRTVKKLKV